MILWRSARYAVQRYCCGKLDTTGTWATHIKAVKDANPKP